MRDIFLESYVEDVQKAYTEGLKNGSEEYKKKKAEADKIYDEFWDMLSKEQREKYRDMEIALGVAHDIEDEDVYVFTLKKGIAMGIEIAKKFK